MDEPWPLGILFLALTLGVPGVMISILWARRPLADGAGDTSDALAAERLGVALAVPTALLVLACELLARVGLLDTVTVWIYAGAATVTALAFLVVQRAAVRSWRSAYDFRATLRGLPAALIVVGAAAVQVRMVLLRMDSLQAPTPWYYWQTSVAIARSGMVPSSAHEWGVTFPFFNYHLGFNALGAGVAVATGTASSIFAAQLLRIVAVVGAVLGSWILARVWGAPRYAAAAAAIALPCVSIFSVKLASYRPEAAGYMLLLLTPALLHRWFKHGGRLLLVATVVAFVGAAELHTPAAMVALALCAATAVVQFRPSWRWIGAAAGVGLLLVGTWFVADAVTGHRGPFAGDFADPPHLTKSGKDPTYEFAQLALGYSPPDANLGLHAPALSTLLDKSFTDGFVAWGTSGYRVFIAAFALVAIGAFALRRWSVVRCLGIVVVFVALLLALAAASSFGWHTYVPRRTGYTRLVQLWWVAPLAFIPLGVTLVDRKLFRIATTVVLLVAAGAVWIASIHDTDRLIDNQPRRATLDDVQALPIPHGALVLTNTFTQDFVMVNTPGTGLLDGRAPYLEADMLGRTNTIMRAASSYFTDPAGHPFPFRRYGVQYVLVQTEPYALGNIAQYGKDPANLATDPRLQLVRKTPGVTLYRVKR